jgi:hypothetical protein
MDRWVQCLHAPAQQFWEAGEVFYSGDGEAGGFQGACCPSRGDEFDVQLG